MLSTWTRLPTLLRTSSRHCTRHFRYTPQSVFTQCDTPLTLKRCFSAKPVWRNEHNDRKPDRLPPPPHVVLANKLRDKLPTTMRENIYTIPNFLTVSRILACPVLGWSILDGNFYLATSILAYAGASDWLDGFLARKYKMHSVLGTILDPAADKTLMTTLVVTTCMKGLLPLPLLVIILGRDVILSLSAFYIRYTSLPEPKTFKRYWDFSIPSAEVRPTMISKVNTALQIALMGATIIEPILPYSLYTPFSDISLLSSMLPFDFISPLSAMHWIVATTTIWSGLSYLLSKDAVRIVAQSASGKKHPPSSL